MCHLKRHRRRIRSPDRPRRSRAPSSLYRRRQPHAVHQGARQARPIHAGRSRGAMRATTAAASAVRAGRLRPGDPRLRQCHRRRNEPGARRRVAARHGRGDDGIHGADQLRLRHAVDRHRLPLHPRRRVRPSAGGRRGITQPCAARLQPQRGELVRTALCRSRHRSKTHQRSSAFVLPSSPR